jgi:dienelactone hydrolase
MFNNSNKYSKYVVGFIAFAFTLIQGVDFVLIKLSMEVNYLPYLLLALLVSFFIGLFFIRKKQEGENAFKVPKSKSNKKWTLYLNIIVTILLGALFVYYFQKGKSDKSLLNEKLPEIVQAYDKDEFALVYKETKELLDAGNTNSIVQSYYEKVTEAVAILTEPSGVQVYFSYLNDSTNTWYSLGKTPLENVRVPGSRLQWKFSINGNDYFEIAHTYYIKNDYNNFILPNNNEILNNHVLFLGGKKPLTYPGIDHLPAVEIGPYSMSKFEVTNKEFKEFVDQGGYSNVEFWDFPYSFGNEELTFDSTIKTFIDKHGQFGPAEWSYGNYPEGQENFPVTGISWFEARAYAKFKNLSLPNLYQWANAAMLSGSSSFVPKSNFSKNQLVEVGSLDNQNQNLIYDIAGNAREWVINSTNETNTQKGILGGGYEDDPYYFNDYYGQNILDRSSSNGMRLVQNLSSDLKSSSVPENPVAIATRDFLNEETVSNDVFEIFKEQYNYADKPLNPKLIPQDISSGTLRIDRFEISSPYEDNGVLPGYVFYDSNQKKPLKPIILFPGSEAIHLTNIDYSLKSRLKRYNYLLSEGYAVFLPMFLSTYERVDELKSDYPDESEFYKDHMIKWGKEYKRTIDYIFSRDDMDHDNLSYYGTSWGGYMANILLAIDDRVQCAVLYVAGLSFQKSKKEVEAYHYTSRITMPVLMLNGEFDQFFPLETSQIPMFKLLKTKSEDKKHFVSKTGHFVPADVLIKEHLGWLKKYEQ